MDILIIGNGFDLAHGLKTSYKDFLDFCKEQSRTHTPVTYFDYKHCLATNLWLKHFINRQEKLGDTWIDLEKEIYEVVKFINKHPTASNSGSTSMFCPKILLIEKTDNSFTFNQLKEQCFKQPNDLEQIKTNNYKILTQIVDSRFVEVYLEKSNFFINFLYDQLREFTKGFELYLIHEVLEQLNENSPYKLSLQSIGVAPSSQDVHILSFNYTDTCEKLYNNKFNTYCELRIKPVYVHGKVGCNNTCELVLGTHSFESSEKYDAISPRFNVFKKHYQRHKYGTIESYQDLLKKLINQEQKIKPVFHIIGHSLEETDHKILRHILTANKNATIKIYYHSEDAQEKMMRNIDDIIGEDEVMTRVQLIDQHDEKRGLLRPVKKKVLTLS